MTSKINHAEEGRHKEWWMGGWMDGWMDGVGQGRINHGVTEDTEDGDIRKLVLGKGK